MDRENIEEILKKLGSENVPAEIHKITEETSKNFSETLIPPRQHILWENIMKTRITKLAAAAVIVIIVLSGITFWPNGSSENTKWWLGQPAAWGQEVMAELEKIEALIYRQQVMFVPDDGPPRMSTGWERRYNAKDRYRRDRYDDGENIMNIQWVIPDGEDLLLLEVSLEYECYFEKRNEPHGFIPDPVDKMRSYVKLLDRADLILDTETFEGRKCIGFEIGGSKRKNNSKRRFDRIWFDVETKLPARIERHGLVHSSQAEATYTIIHDQFEYYIEVPLDIFEPQVPEGFINAHPDEVRADREKEQQR